MGSEMCIRDSSRPIEKKQYCSIITLYQFSVFKGAGDDDGKFNVGWTSFAACLSTYPASAQEDSYQDCSRAQNSEYRCNASYCVACARATTTAGSRPT